MAQDNTNPQTAKPSGGAVHVAEPTEAPAADAPAPAPAAPSTDSGGTDRYDTYTVQPLDNVGIMANELFDKNPGLYPSPAAAQRAIINFNNSFRNLPRSQRPEGWRLITDGEGGIDCTGNKVNRSWLIQPNQIIYYPEAPNEIVDPKTHDRNCPPPPPLAPAGEAEVPDAQEPPAALRQVRRRVVESEGMAARLPIYAPSTNLAGGRSSDPQDIANMLPLLRDVPKQPHTAARAASSHNPLGIQTFADLGARILRVAPFVPIPLGNPATASLALTPIGLDMDTRGRGLGHEREGSGATVQDSANDHFRMDILPFGPDGLFAPSSKTKRDATLLWGVGITHDEQGRVVDIKTGERAGLLNHNEIYSQMGEGENILAITSNQRSERTGGEKQNWRLQGKPSGPKGIPLGNYEIASYIDSRYASGALDNALNALDTDPSQANFQQAIALTNLRANLTGMTNYPVRADISQPLDGKGLDCLNPREMLLYSRERLIEAATAKGYTVNPDEIAVPQSISRAEMRAQLIDYYTETALVKPQSFPDVFEEVTGKKAKYDKDDVEQRRAVATEFADSLPYLQTYPENGYSMEHLKPYYLSPREQFSSVERFEYTSKTPPKDASVLAAGMEALASDPENVRAILKAAETNDLLATSIAMRDKGSIAAPKWFDNHKGGLNRNDEVAAVAARGYSAELMDLDFSKDASRDNVIRNLPAIKASLGASAASDEIVALRQRDLRQMPTDGKDGKPIAPGATANNLLHVLAQDTKLLATFDENIRKSSATPEEAEAKIEALHQAVLYAKDHVTERHTGFGKREALAVSHTELAAYAYQHSEKCKEGGEPVAVINGYFANPNTNATALSALNEKDPKLMSALVLQTLRDNPALQEPVLDQLDEFGKSRMFRKAEQDVLANTIGALLKAEKAGNEGKVTALSMKLDGLLSDPAYAVAASDLFVATSTTVAGGVDGRTALTRTLTTTVDAAAKGNSNALPGYSVGGEQLLTNVYTAVTTFDPANAEALAAEGARVLNNRYTSTGKILPFIITPNPYRSSKKPDEPDPELPRDNPPTPPDPGCKSECVVPTPPQPPTDVPLPPTPPPTPPAPKPPVDVPVPPAQPPVPPAPKPPVDVPLPTPTPITPTPITPTPLPPTDVPLPTPPAPPPPPPPKGKGI